MDWLSFRAVMKVLIAEDFEPLRSSLSKGLRENGYAVDAAEDGREGLWYTRGSQCDAIILDVMVPKMDGWTVLRRLREAGSQDPVLILTARPRRAGPRGNRRRSPTRIAGSFSPYFHDPVRSMAGCRM